jgi:hypothetical protein
MSLYQIKKNYYKGVENEGKASKVEIYQHPHYQKICKKEKNNILTFLPCKNFNLLPCSFFNFLKMEAILEGVMLFTRVSAYEFLLLRRS